MKLIASLPEPAPLLFIIVVHFRSDQEQSNRTGQQSLQYLCYHLTFIEALIFRQV